MRQKPEVWKRVAETSVAAHLVAQTAAPLRERFAQKVGEPNPRLTPRFRRSIARPYIKTSEAWRFPIAVTTRCEFDAGFRAECNKRGRRWTSSAQMSTPHYSWQALAVGARVSSIEAELHDLMVRGLAGDAVAHRQLLDLLSTQFRIFFQRRLRMGDPSYAEDLVQETLIAIHSRRDSYDPSKPVTAWVYAIARYKMIDYFRRTKTTGISVPVDQIDELFSNERADSTDAARDVATLLHHLPSKQRMAIRLVKLEDLSVREAAMRSGMSESDIKISIHRGMKKLSALVAKGDRS